MERVLEVYKRPYDPRYPVICLDESPKQLLSETQTPVRLADGTLRVDYTYQREGTCDIYMVCEPLAGWRGVTICDSHSRFEWGNIVAHLVEHRYRDAEKITLVQDNLSAHTPSVMYELFEPERAQDILEKIEFVFTPKHGSWLNIAEIELSVLQRQCLGDERIGSKEALQEKTKAWETERNDSVVTVDWQFTTSDARIKLKRLYPSIVT